MWLFLVYCASVISEHFLHCVVTNLATLEILIYYHTQLPSSKLKVKNLHYFYGSLSHWWKVTFQENLNIHIYHGKSWYLSTTISEFSASATAQQPQPSFFLLAHRIVGLQSKCFRQPNTERIFFKTIKNDQCYFQSHC